MLKKGILLAGFTIVLTVLIFNLPKSVVKSGKASIGEENGHTEDHDETLPGNMFSHGAEIPAEGLEKINDLRQKFKSSIIKEKSAIFADSLAALFVEYHKYDSAAKYLEFVADVKTGKEHVLKAADAYYKAFTFAIDESKALRFGDKARALYERVLEADPGNLEVKTNIAMTYVSTSNPMKGIVMLREILEKNPDHEGALFNMGLLSMQSNQFEKAKERFERLHELNPDHLQAEFFLAVSYFNLGSKRKAKEHFEKLQTRETDPGILATIENYLKDI